MKKADAESCACTSVRSKMPFTAATSGSISDVMKPQAKNNVVTAAKAAAVPRRLVVNDVLPLRGLAPRSSAH